MGKNTQSREQFESELAEVVIVELAENSVVAEVFTVDVPGVLL